MEEAPGSGCLFAGTELRVSAARVCAASLALELDVDRPPGTDRYDLQGYRRDAVDDPQPAHADPPHPRKLPLQGLTEIGIAQ